MRQATEPFAREHCFRDLSFVRVTFPWHLSLTKLHVCVAGTGQTARVWTRSSACLGACSDCVSRSELYFASKRTKNWIFRVSNRFGSGGRDRRFHFFPLVAERFFQSKIVSFGFSVLVWAKSADRFREFFRGLSEVFDCAVVQRPSPNGVARAPSRLVLRIVLPPAQDHFSVVNRSLLGFFFCCCCCCTDRTASTPL